MPLVVFSGRPCTGKTAVAGHLAALLTEKGFTVKVVNEEGSGIDHSAGYADSKAEKVTRATIKSAVERSVSTSTVVIADSMNYIKGYRYELFSLCRAQSTPYCVVFVDTPKDVAATWNATAGSAAAAGAGADSGAGRYSEELFESLWDRFEAPDESNRWDSPLFRVDADSPPEELSEFCDRVLRFGVQGRAHKPLDSTVTIALGDSNTLHAIERCVAGITAAVKAALPSAVVGESIVVPGSKVPLVLLRKPSQAELGRLRRQFLKIAKLHPNDSDAANIGTMFVKYMNTNLAPA